jgi:hypothetical protein
MCTQKVKLVAIAKDEAAYIPEWVFHHLHVGFDKIEIYVNRTSDNTENMLNYIESLFPNVSHYSADWIDTCPEESTKNLQYIIYAKAFFDTQINMDADYIMFLDIDEFWTPSNLSVSIHQIITKYPKADAISFQWLNEYGNDEKFSPLSGSTVGKINPLVKTLIKTSAKVEKHGYHMPKLSPQSKHIMMDGTEIVLNNKHKEGIDKSIQRIRPVMIIHRLFRSPDEYVSLLHRGRPSDSVELKLNRGGYNVIMGPEHTYELEKNEYEKYSEKKGAFLDEPKLKTLLNEAKAFIGKRCEKALASISAIQYEHLPDIAKIFRGCADHVSSRVECEVASSRFVKKHKNVEQLIEIAKEVERYSPSLALLVWQRAKALRPSGPLIIKKLANCERKLKEKCSG